MRLGSLVTGEGCCLTEGSHNGAITVYGCDFCSLVEYGRGVGLASGHGFSLGRAALSTEG